MAIKFFNVRSGETRTIDPATIDPNFIEPAIAALFNSSNLHVNAMAGQDFGWRIAPETIKRIKEIKLDDALLNRIADRIKVLPENISDPEILTWIVHEDARKEAAKNEAVKEDFEAQYDAEVRDVKSGKMSDSQLDQPLPAKEAESTEELEAQAAEAAKRNEKTSEQKQKEQAEEDRLMAELEDEEARENAKTSEATKDDDKKVAKSQGKADNKSNS